MRHTLGFGATTISCEQCGGGRVDVTLEAVAEDLDAYILRPSTSAREDRGNVVVINGPGPSPLESFACRIRFGSDPDAAINATRGWFRERGRQSFTWKLGAHTTPMDLEERLRAHGAHEDEAEPEHTAMVLDTPPPAVDGIEVRVVETFDDYVRAAEIMFVGFGGSFTEDEVATMRAALPERYAEYRDQSVSRRYLAVWDGAPVAAATAIRTSTDVVALGGGATLPEARGRGGYRALVHARWVDAVAQGQRGLATQASGMSRPILETLGFRVSGPVLELIDTSDAS